MAQKVNLKSCDEERFEVDKTVALELQIVKNFIDDDSNYCADKEISIPQVTGNILAKVIEYCNKHVASASALAPDGSPSSREELNRWDADFIKMDNDTLFKILNAAIYLNINELVDLACKSIADSIKCLSPEEIRIYFNLENDFTPEEEAKVRQEAEWAFK